MDVDDKREALEKEIIADARKRAERIIKRAERDARKALEEAGKAGTQHAGDIKREAEERAEVEYRRLTAGIPALINRRILIAREGVLEGIIEDAAKELPTRFARSPAEHMKALVMEAVLAMPEDNLIVTVREQDKSVLDQQLLQSIIDDVEKRQGRKLSLTVSADSASISGGVIVECRSGRAVYDNSFEARLNRLRDELRVKLARMLFPEE